MIDEDGEIEVVVGEIHSAVSLANDALIDVERRLNSAQYILLPVAVRDLYGAVGKLLELSNELKGRTQRGY